WASEIDHLSAREHHTQCEYVIGRRSVLQTMNAARTLRNVASDCAAWLARRIRNVIETIRSNCFRDVEVHYARLDHGDSILSVDAENLAHARELNHDARVQCE